MPNLFKHSLSIREKQTMIDITKLINENADQDVVRDLIYGFEKSYPTYDKNYRHFEGNSHAHMKSSTVGLSQSLILNDVFLILGRCQDVYFCEFYYPRQGTFI